MKKEISNEKQELIKIELNNERVLTTSQLAKVYGTDVNNIQSNFKRNFSRFQEGKHFIKLEGKKLKEFKNQPTQSQLVDKRTSCLYLWTLKGANRHCKILDTDKAWQQFDILEETYFKIRKAKSPIELLELQFQAIKNQDLEIKAVKEDFEEFKTNIPLFGNEQEDLQRAVRSKGTFLLGGRNTAAYNDKSLRQRLYSDLQREIKRQFGVNTYKAIKRSQLNQAKEIVRSYKPPLVMQDEIILMNNQMHISKIAQNHCDQTYGNEHNNISNFIITSQVAVNKEV